MTKIYLENIAYAIEDVLEADYGITEGNWGVGIDAGGDPFVEVFDDEMDEPLTIEEVEIIMVPEEPLMIGSDLFKDLPTSKVLSTDDLFDIIFGGGDNKDVSLSKPDDGEPLVENFTMKFYPNGKIEIEGDIQ